MNSTLPAVVIRARLLMARVLARAAEEACDGIAGTVGCNPDEVTDVIFNNANPDDFLHRHGLEETRHDA